MTWIRDEAVKIRTQPTGPLSYEIVSVPTAFAKTVKELPNKPALGKRTLSSVVLHHWSKPAASKAHWYISATDMK